MDYPEGLVPSSVETVDLGDGVSVHIPKATPRFRPWLGQPMKFTFGGKPALEVAESAGFAELAILRLFEAAEWSGRWIETYGAPAMSPRFLTGWIDENIRAQTSVPLNRPWPQEFIMRIAELNGESFSGCWDVLA